MDEVNTVRLVGRVSAAGEPRELPSGDVVVMLRVVVPRAAQPAEPPKTPEQATQQ